MCWTKIKPLFSKPAQPEKPVEPKRVKTWFDKLKEKFPSARFISTSAGGPNMPKRQPWAGLGTGVTRIKRGFSLRQNREFGIMTIILEGG